MFVECRHILTSGRKCHSPALRGKPFCFFHAKLHFRNGNSRRYRKLPQYAVPDLLDIQADVNKTIATLNSPLTDTRRAGLLLYGFHLAAHLQTRIEKSGQVPDNSVPPEV